VPRSSLPDGYFHVYARGVDRRTPIFRDDLDRRRFLHLTWRAEPRFDWTCHALCLLGTHYHLVVEARRVDLSAGLRWLNWVYAMSFNRRHARFGHVFAERFGCRAIESDEYLNEVCAYVLLNPVRAGLCDRIEDWPWSYSRHGLHAA
jgi:REP element-mobilizing transposase RayT